MFAELKQLQSTLDPIDISTLATRFQHAYPKDALFDPALITEPDSTELEEFVEKYLENPSRGVEKDGWTLREHMIAYALSAIFKDCSIFVSIPLVKVGDEWTVKPGTKVKIIDLDLKDVKNLGKWHDLDRAIWQHWLETHLPANGHNEKELSKDPATTLDGHPGALTLLSQSQEGTSPHNDPSVDALLVSTPVESGQETSAWPSAVERAAVPHTGDDLSSIEGVSVPSASHVSVKESETKSDQASGGSSTPVMETAVPGSHGPSRYNGDDVETRPSLASEIDIDEDEDSGRLPESRGASSTSEGRKKRSWAPSPSPTPFKADLPDGLATVVPVSENEASVEQKRTEQVDKDGHGLAGIALGLGLATIGGSAAAALSKGTGDGRETHGNDASFGRALGIVNDNGETTNIPEAYSNPTAGTLAVPMESSSSGESGRVDEFMTPMAEMPESSVAPAPVKSEVDSENTAHSFAAGTPQHPESVSPQAAEHNDTEQPIASSTIVEAVGASSGAAQMADLTSPSSAAIAAESIHPSDYGTDSAYGKGHTVREDDHQFISQPESLDDGDAVKSDNLGSDLLHQRPKAINAPVEVSSEPSVETTNESVSQGSLNATSVTGETLENNRLPAIAPISTEQIRGDGPAGLMLDKVDEVSIMPAKRDALLAEFEPHSLPPVLERGESTLAVGQSAPVSESILMEGPNIDEPAKFSGASKEAEPYLDKSISPEDLVAANPAISIHQVPNDPDAPVTENRGAFRCSPDMYRCLSSSHSIC